MTVGLAFGELFCVACGAPLRVHPLDVSIGAYSVPAVQIDHAMPSCPAWRDANTRNACLPHNVPSAAEMIKAVVS